MIFQNKGENKIRALRVNRLGLLLSMACIISAGCRKAPPAQSEFALGTKCTVNLYQYGSARLYRALFSRLREIEGYLSVTIPDSDVAALNRGAGTVPVKVHPEFIEVLGRALYYAELSGGAFDPTVGPLTALWGISSENPRVPGEDEIRAVLPLINWRDVLINGDEVLLRRSGMGIDLGAIAKGYAADELAGLLRAAAVPGALIDLGGNIFAHGEKPGGNPWRIGIQDPLDERGASIGFLEVRDKTVVTSGVYERFIEAGGRRYHHILSTRNGWPVDQGLLSVTITADRSMDADALSTAAFALGYDQGRALVEAAAGAEALFVFDDRSIRGTGGFLSVFTLNNQGYKIVPD